MSDLPAGTRIRMTADPWPERDGCVGTVIGPPPGKQVYPWAGKGASEIVVLLDTDPLANYAHRKDHGWSCVTGRQKVVLVLDKPSA